MRHGLRRKTIALVAGVALAGGSAWGLLASPVSASPLAAENDPTTPTTEAAPVEAASAQTTLPLFGAPLVVDVATTPNGQLASVDVTPAAGLTATKVHPNRVTFVNDAATGKLRVETRHGSQKTAVVAGTLDDIKGPGGWVGDVFGTGTNTTVGFTIAATADGSPDITDISSSDSSAVIGDVQHMGGDHGAVARATITFTSGIQSRRLTITAVVISVGDKSRASSQVTLSKVSGVALPADQAAGDHTWTGKLCDGSTATVAYSVANDGTITAGAVTPSSATASADGNTLKVKFSDTESVVIRVAERDGNLRISAQPKLRCDRATPTVNTPVSPNATNDGHHRPGQGDDPGSQAKDRGDGHRDGWGRGSH